MPSGSSQQRLAPKSRRKITPEKPFSFDRAISPALILLTLAVYFQVRDFPFVGYDDPFYFVGNPHVTGGLTLENLKWALTAVVADNWIPVTLLSHILACQFFGVASGMHHLINLLLHAASTLLLFAALRRATGAPWPSAFTAFLFALHPLHVESVVWVSERKDVLSAFFCFLALYLYVRYAERPSLGAYLAVAASFALGLMSKPMLVTFPFVLLLFDVWPLRRTAQFPKILWEKAPLLGLSAAASVVTYFVQRSTGAMHHSFPLALRLENALISYAVYIRQVFWPAGFAVLYPYPKSFPAWEIAVALIVVAGVTAMVIRLRETRPYLAMGWFWYLGTLVPVIGLIQVGKQSHADRYTYIPMVGLGIMLAWGAADLLRERPQWKPAITAVAAVACTACVVLTWIQTGYWDDSGKLFQHALDVTRENAIIELDVGSYLMKQPGRAAEAMNHIQTALRIDPDYFEAHSDLGTMLVNTPGRLPDAIAEFRTGIRLEPGNAVEHRNLANALAASPEHLREALPEYQTALRLNAGDPDTHADYAATLLKVPGRWKDAVSEYQAALRLDPNLAKAQSGLAAALDVDPARIAAAAAPYEAELRLHPNSAQAHNNLGALLARVPGRTDEAVSHLTAAVRLNPVYEYQLNLALLLSTLPGRESESLVYFEAAQRLHPTPEVQQIIDRLHGRKP